MKNWLIEIIKSFFIWVYNFPFDFYYDMRYNSDLRRDMIVISTLILIAVGLGFWIGQKNIPSNLYCIDTDEFSEETVFFSKDVMELINNKWDESFELNKEIGFCLNLTNNTVTGIFDITYGSENSVNMTLTNCTNAALHTHPKGSCVPSHQDAVFAKLYPLNYSAILCGRDKIKVYDAKEYTVSKKVVMMQ